VYIAASEGTSLRAVSMHWRASCWILCDAAPALRSLVWTYPWSDVKAGGSAGSGSRLSFQTEVVPTARV
jgi:hypothetical protein